MLGGEILGHVFLSLKNKQKNPQIFAIFTFWTGF
jgi:hypothetical protein